MYGNFGEKKNNSIAFAERLATDILSGLCHFSAWYTVITGDHVIKK
jgi:hypothetical protein